MRSKGEAVAVVSIVREYYKVGDQAANSGIYRAVHGGHRKDHSIVVVRGDEFPACRFCKDAVTFIPLETAPYVTHDLDFAGPRLERAEG